MHNPTRFHKDCLKTFHVILLTVGEMDRRTDEGENTTFLAVTVIKFINWRVPSEHWKLCAHHSDTSNKQNDRAGDKND